MSLIVPTAEVRMKNGTHQDAPVIITASDFDSKLHEAWSAKPKVPPKQAGAADPPKTRGRLAIAGTNHTATESDAAPPVDPSK